LQAFCGNPRRISVVRGCYPYDNLDVRPDLPEKGLAKGRFPPSRVGAFHVRITSD
jgi:hypothetical protein